MSDTAARPGFFKRLIDGAGGILFAILLFGAFGYLTSGQGRLEFMVAPGNLAATVVAVVGALLALLLLATRLLDHLPWHGVMPLPVAEGHSWTRSALSRLLIVLFSGSLLWWWTGFVGMVFQAWYQADWLRLVLAVALGLGAGVLAIGVVGLALTRRPLLWMDNDGLFERRIGRMAWSEIEKIGVGRDPSSRQVYLFLNTGRALGPARTLSLNEVGLTAEQFVACVETVAPQVTIDRPEPPARVFN